MPNKIIEIKNLSYAYPDGTTALSNINLDIYKGETLGIIGPNGAGKSTLLLHLNGILKGSGTVSLCHKMDPCFRRDDELGCKIFVGLVFQDPDDQLFMPTVYEDVAFGPMNMGLSREKVDQAVKNALSQVDMSAAANRSAHHMSFGEKKRVSIATVLSMDPEILVLDEPTSNLDPKHRRELIEFLQKLSHTKIIATHDLDLVGKICDRVAIFDGGKIIAVDSTDRIIRNQELLLNHGLA